MYNLIPLPAGLLILRRRKLNCGKQLILNVINLCFLFCYQSHLKHFKENYQFYQNLEYLI